MLGAIVGLTLLLLSDGVIDPAGRSSRTRNLRISWQPEQVEISGRRGRACKRYNRL
jgi:hypothetical protein